MVYGNKDFLLNITNSGKTNINLNQSIYIFPVKKKGQLLATPLH
jgi:hypothetical protein